MTVPYRFMPWSRRGSARAPMPTLRAARAGDAAEDHGRPDAAGEAGRRHGHRRLRQCRPHALRPGRHHRHRPAPDRAHRPPPQHHRLRAELPGHRRLRSARLPLAADPCACRCERASATLAGSRGRRAQAGRAAHARRRPAAAIDPSHGAAGRERIARPGRVVAVGAYAGAVAGRRRPERQPGPGRDAAVGRNECPARAQHLAPRLPAPSHAEHRLCRLRRPRDRRRLQARSRPAGGRRDARSGLAARGAERPRAAGLLLLDFFDRPGRRHRDAGAAPADASPVRRRRDAAEPAAPHRRAAGVRRRRPSSLRRTDAGADGLRRRDGLARLHARGQQRDLRRQARRDAQQRRPACCHRHRGGRPCADARAADLRRVPG